MNNVRMIVTGGGSGIGYAVAAEASHEARPWRCSTSSRSGAPPDALQLKADVTDDESVVRQSSEAAAAMGGVDVVVNNAGIGAQGTVETNSIDEWQRVFDVNVLRHRAGVPSGDATSARRRRVRRSSTPARSARLRACRSGPCTAPRRAR